MDLVKDSPEYYRHREQQELEAVAKAQSDDIAQIHRALAAKYRELAKEAEKRA